MKYYTEPKIDILAISTADVITLSQQDDGSDPYIEVYGDWEGIINGMNKA